MHDSEIETVIDAAHNFIVDVYYHVFALMHCKFFRLGLQR